MSESGKKNMFPNHVIVGERSLQCRGFSGPSPSRVAVSSALSCTAKWKGSPLLVRRAADFGSQAAPGIRHQQKCQIEDAMDKDHHFFWGGQW